MNSAKIPDFGRNMRVFILIMAAILALAPVLPAVFAQAPLAISTTPEPLSATVGTDIADYATVSGGDNPTGTVTFVLYNNPDCMGPALFADTETLVSGAATSEGYTTTAAGTDYWVATYNGDAQNLPISSACAAEPVAIRGPNSVPEFPIASLSSLLLIALLLPALFLMGRRFRAIRSPIA
jgi:hypothetical protein